MEKRISQIVTSEDVHAAVPTTLEVSRNTLEWLWMGSALQNELLLQLWPKLAVEWWMKTHLKRYCEKVGYASLFGSFTKCPTTPSGLGFAGTCEGWISISCGIIATMDCG